MLGFNGLAMGMGDMARMSDAESRSISAENPTGEKGRGAMATEGAGAAAARDLGLGWKVAPSINVESGEVVTLADIEGPGQIQSIWLGGAVGRDYILRFYWDDQEQPSVECPNSDLFGIGWAHDRGGRKHGHADINSLAVNVCPNRGLNCFWPMPFRKRCRITLENRDVKTAPCYYQINYTLADVPDDLAYFHAQFRRVNPLPYKGVYTVLDGVEGRGQYVGTAMAWGVNNDGWWGEGEIKFFMDGDHTVHGHAPGHPSRRHVPRAAPPRHVPVARHGPHQVQGGPARDDPGAGLAQRGTLPAHAGRHRLRGVLVSDAAHAGVS